MTTLVQRISDGFAAVRNKLNTMTPALLPAGGSQGQVLVKNTANPFDVLWATIKAYTATGAGLTVDGNGVFTLASNLRALASAGYTPADAAALVTTNTQVSSNTSAIAANTNNIATNTAAIAAGSRDAQRALDRLMSGQPMSVYDIMSLPNDGT
jgi:hypothetical protein